ncbi:MAG: phosphoribosylanthranilate isomerase [Verrucomicrobiota bacterium]|jgi:phosphoribosylanthranilate isomerase
MTPRVKICGITNLADAQLAVEFGADALGFIFYRQSKRSVTPEIAAEICAALPPFVAKVGVFVNESADGIQQILTDCRLDAVQLHGEELPSFCQQFQTKVIKAIRVRDADSLRVAAEYDVDALLLDTYTAEQRGGTGQTFDWTLAQQAKTSLRPPIILSGGLTPESIRAAIRQAEPFAVDVASGVESEPGRKDPEKLRRFFKACRQT